MSRCLASFILILSFLIQSCGALPRLNDSRPNFLIIITDDQRFDTMEYMPETQSLIFDQGVTFSSGYVTTPFCCPSRASILTGMYAHNTYVHVNEDPLLFPTVVEDLHKNGYYTGLVGKYLNSWKGEPRSEYDYWVSFFGGTVPNYYDPNLNINGEWQKKTGYITYLFKDYVIEFLDLATRQRKPFMLIFAPNAPHAPFTPLKEDRGLYQDLPVYRPANYNEEDVSDKPGSISRKPLFTEEDIKKIDSTRRRQILTLTSLDRSIGEIMKKLQETGELDNTVVIFISDNGIHWGEHRLDGKSSAYEESIKVPFAVRYPGLIPAPYIDYYLVANIVIAPTLYDLSDSQAPDMMDGASLISLLKGSGEWRAHLLLEAWPDRGPWTAIRADSYIYIETDNEVAEFYDLTADPFELNNAINDPQYQTIIAELKGYLQQEKEPRTVQPEKK